MVIFCDIDGVVADCSHRLHFLEDKNYDKFYSKEEMTKDVPIKSGAFLLNALYSSPYECAIVFVTGRPYRTEEWTREWLIKKARFKSAEFATILMRKNHDYRPSDVIKVEAIKKFLNENCYRGEYLFIDDDPKNVQAVEKSFPQIRGIVFGTERLF